MRLFKGRDEFDLTSGGIAWPLFYLSLPIVVTNLLQTAYNLADTFWLGQHSTEALAAISFAFPMVFLLIALAIGISIAGSVLVAQNVGAGDEARAEYVASQTMSFAILAALALGGVGYFLVEDFVALLGASPAVLPLAAGYMEVFSLGLVSVFGFAVFISLMRGYGDTVTPMLVMFGSVVVNIALDPFLIFGWWRFPALGVEGAAVATVFSRTLALAVGLWIMLRGTRGVQIHPKQMIPDPAFARRIFEVGAPASVEVTGRALSVNLLLVIVGLFPTTVVAAYGIGARVFSVIFLPAIAVSQGVETMTGQNIGAGEPDRAAAANHFAAKAMFAILSAVGVVAFVAAEPVISVFTSDPDVIGVGVDFLRYTALTFGGIGIMRAYTGGFRGAGRTLIAAAVSVLMLGVIRLPVAWVGAEVVGATGIWIAFAVSNVAGAVIAYRWFERGTWRGADVTGAGPAAPGELGAEKSAADD
ncbi:MATE family efflux transporter [Halegenticoccus soli]|uniref:MATE family efflux transporter n=1 Tax=Halegenticoccus soli TaxID=1985678 RepID=UPI000C6D8A17|nr:MATE family efflux transporter [Halegenticoccus soli]